MTKVLVVDDEQDIREALVDILFGAGYDVIEARDGGTGLEKAHQEHPDLILLDVMMPVMDGFEVLKHLKETPTTAAIPVVMLTAMEAAKGEGAAMELGAEHYIAKPWETGTVEAVVRVALREAGTVSDEGSDTPKVWHGSTSYLRTTNEPGVQGFIRTGDLLKPLEQKLGGGIPLGSLTLIEGAAAVGKSVVCQHLTYGALVDRHCTAYFTSEHTAGSLGKQMGSIGLGISKYLRDDQLCIYPVQEPTPGEDTGPLIGELARHIERLPVKYEFIVVDAITNLAAYSQEQLIVRFFSSCKRLCSKGRTIVVVAHSHAFAENMFSRVSALSDSHLKLRTGKVRDKVIRILELIKVDNVELNSNNTITFDVESKTGIRITQLSQAKV